MESNFLYQLRYSLAHNLKPIRYYLVLRYIIPCNCMPGNLEADKYFYSIVIGLHAWTIDFMGAINHDSSVSAVSFQRWLINVGG